MKFLIFFLAFAVHSLNASEQNILPHVIGGTNTLWGQYPASVILETPNDYCGGSVLDDLHILTAANCVLNPRMEVIHPQWFRVIAGDIFFSPNTPSRLRSIRRVSRIFVHPEFNAFNGDSNIAILRLETRFPLPSNAINPARRQTRIVRNGLSCALIAFGRQTNITDTALRPQQINLPIPIMDRNACNNHWAHANRITDNVICGQTANNAAPCTGSMGSGLYCNNILTGVLSGGSFCNNTPAIFQQVRAFNNWIDSIINNHSNEPQNFNPINTQGFPTVWN